MADRVRILVALGPRGAARRLLERAAVVAGPLAGELWALRVVDAPGEAGAALDEVRALIADAGVDAIADVAVGSAALQVERRARDLDAALVIVGRGGEPGQEPGPVTAHVALRGDRSVLVVGRVVAEPDRAVVGVECSAPSAHMLAELRALLPAARLEVVHVAGTPGVLKLRGAGVTAAELAALEDATRRQAADALDRVLEAVGPVEPADRRVVSGEAAVELLAAATGTPPPILAVGAPHGADVRALLVGSVTEQVLRHAAGEVLVVRPRS